MSDRKIIYAQKHLRSDYTYLFFFDFVNRDYYLFYFFTFFYKLTVEFNQCLCMGACNEKICITFTQHTHHTRFFCIKFTGWVRNLI